MEAVEEAIAFLLIHLCLLLRYPLGVHSHELVERMDRACQCELLVHFAAVSLVESDLVQYLVW